MRATGAKKENNKKTLLFFLVSILAALGVTYIILKHLPLIIAGFLLLLIAALIFIGPNSYLAPHTPCTSPLLRFEEGKTERGGE